MYKIYLKYSCLYTGNLWNSYAKKMMLLFAIMIIASSSYGQSKRISGTVKDNKDLAIPGVTVKLKDGTAATATNSDGSFTINVVDEKSVLVFTYTGYQTVERIVGAQTNMAIVLQESDTDLEQVVIVGYGKQKKVNVIGSVATIDAKSLENRPVSNLSSSLGGLSAGVRVAQSSGRPGADGATIRIRGTGTLNNNDALVIVDGIMGSLDMVNPNDVENISVLKDAAAASIYGSLAANGVILVTTKKGTLNKSNVSYTGMTSISTPAGLPGFVSDYITHMKLVNEGFKNLGQTPNYTDATMALWQSANANPNGLTAQGIPNYIAYPNTDWGKEIFENNLMQQHNVSLNGGSDKTQYLLSIGYLDNPGVMVNAGSERYNFRVNLQSKINKFLTVGTQTFGSMQSNGLANTNQAFNFLNQTMPGIYPLYNGLYGFPIAAEESQQANNIFTYLNGTGGSDKETRVSSTIFATVDILKGLQFETRFNYYTRFKEYNAHTNTVERWNFATNTLKVAKLAPSQLSTVYSFNKNYGTTIDNVLRYDTTLADKHDLGMMVGYNQYYYNYYDTDATKLGLIDETITTLGSATTPTSTGGSEYDYAMRSYFGRLNYAYKSRYLIEGVLRYDGSSRFAAVNRWGFFPAFSAGWRLSEEPFMKNINGFVNNLKIRASWGKTGNNASGNYDYQAVYGSTNYSFNQAASLGLISTKFPNQSLRWESTTTTNLGLDGTLFRGGMSFEIDLYRKYTDGILFTPTIPITTGTALAATQNIAEVSNKGVEVTMGHSGKRGAFAYSVSGNFAYNFNRVTKYKGGLKEGWTTDANGNKVYASNLGNISSGGNQRILEGNMFNELYLHQVYKGNGNYFNSDGTVNIGGGPKDGMIRTPEDMAWLNAMVASGKIFQPTGGVGKTRIWYGDLIYADNNGDGIYGNTYDQYLTNKSQIPLYSFGLNFNLSYKNIDLSMLWSGSAGMWYYWNAPGYSNSVVSIGNGVSKLIANDHYYYNDANPSDPANNITGKYPRLKNTNDPQNSAVASDFFLYNASYVKLKNLQLGYSLPEKIAKKLAMQRARFYVSGENLFTITNYPGLDPEIGPGMGYPTMRQYALGLNITF